MGSINMGGLQGLPSTDFIFKDVALDLQPEAKISSSSIDIKPQSTDILHSLDEGAIKNSILNLFSTMRGENLLDPEFGLGLKRYLFIPVNEDNAENIGNDIVSGLEKYEPRVNIDLIEVRAVPSKYMYEIDMTLSIPYLSITKKVYQLTASESGISF